MSCYEKFICQKFPFRKKPFLDEAGNGRRKNIGKWGLGVRRHRSVREWRVTTEVATNWGRWWWDGPARWVCKGGGRKIVRHHMSLDIPAKKRKLLQSLSGNKFLVPQCHNATRWHSSLAQVFSIWVVRQRLQMWNDHYRHLHELCLPDFQSLQEIIGLLVLVRVVSRKLEQTTTSAADILPLIHKLEGGLGPNSSLLLWDEDWQIQRKVSSAELQPFTAMLRSSMLKSLRVYMNKHV